MPSKARDPTNTWLPEEEIWYVTIVELARAGDKLAFAAKVVLYLARSGSACARISPYYSTLARPIKYYYLLEVYF